MDADTLVDGLTLVGIAVSLWISYVYGTREICPTCGGSGSWESNSQYESVGGTCLRCNGKGKL